MNNDYIRKMQLKENQCLAFMRQAEDALDRNGGMPSKEQCAWLQKAAMLRYEMARMSVGEERFYQQRKLQELNREILDIAKLIDPDLARRMAASNQRPAKDAGKPDGKGEGSDAAGSKAAAPAAGGEVDTTGWFKEAPKHSFDDVSGMAELKDQLKGCIQDLKIQKLKDFLKMPKIHSFFFYGPPGCGKTYIIKAFAHELMDKDYKFISLQSSDVLSKYVGDAEKIVAQVFEEAQKNAPCIIFFDEVDGVCKSRSLPDLPNYASSLTTAFLTGYNSIVDSEKPIIFIGATNYPRQVDNAMLDRVELIRVPLPDQDAREAKLCRDLEGVIPMGDNLNYKIMARNTEGYNYRDLDRLVSKLKAMTLKAVMKEYGNEEDALWGLQSGEFTIDADFFDRALSDCLPTPKDSILRELDEWELEMKQGME